MQALYAIYEIISLLTNVLVMLIIIQFVIGLLFAFNVINQSNQFMMAFYTSINRLLDPVLAQHLENVFRSVLRTKRDQNALIPRLEDLLLQVSPARSDPKARRSKLMADLSPSGPPSSRWRRIWPSECWTRCMRQAAAAMR